MKKYVWGGAGLVALVLVGFLSMLTHKPDARAASTEVVTANDDRLKRGKYLVRHVLVCLGCHSKRDWNHYGGPIVGHPGAGGRCLNERWGMPGRVCAPNLTPDKTSGLGLWTDGEIMRAIREGVSKNGNALFPMMPYEAYRHLSDGDTRAVVSYLRTLKRRASPREQSQIDFPTSYFITTLPAPLTGPVTAPEPSPSKAYGEYLSIVSGCRVCHTPTDSRHRPIPGKEFAGGSEFQSPFGTVRAPNLTPHSTGIRAWSEQRFVEYFHGFREEKAARAVEPGKNTPMPWLEYAGMTTRDLTALYRYLRSIPPLDNKVEVWPAGPG